MKKIKLTLNQWLFCIICLLTLTYIFSFTFKKVSYDKRKLVKTELINEKNTYSIQSFKIIQDNKELTITRLDDIWVALQEETGNYIPCDLKTVNTFIKDMTTLRNVYKLSDNLDPKNNNYGFFDANATKIIYTLENSQRYELLFGKQDFSFSSRYFMTGKSLAVYEMDNSLDKYLSASIQVWSDPYLVSKTILQEVSYKDIQRILVSYTDEEKPEVKNFKTISPQTKDFDYIAQKLMDLRHGGFSIQSVENDTIEFKLKLEFGNKWEAELSFYNTQDQDNDYNVIAEYYIPQINKSYKFVTKVSTWTYKKIKSMVL